MTLTECLKEKGREFKRPKHDDHISFKVELNGIVCRIDNKNMEMKGAIFMAESLLADDWYLLPEKSLEERLNNIKKALEMGI